MAEQFDVHIVVLPIGSLTNTFRPGFKVPATGGGITILSAHAQNPAAGTVSLNLVTLGTAGTAVDGTIATKGSAVYSATVPQAFTVSTPFVDAGDWVGVEEKNVGTTNAAATVSIAYVMGK